MLILLCLNVMTHGVFVVHYCCLGLTTYVLFVYFDIFPYVSGGPFTLLILLFSVFINNFPHFFCPAFSPS